MHDPSEFDEKYSPGLHNKAIRYYFYITKGLEVLNLFRNLFLAIIGIYIALKLDNWWMLLAMFIPSIFLLFIAGYYSVHHMNKITEWLSVRFSTHYAITQFTLQQEILETLREIRGKIK